jgi:hypothetical protein
MSDIPKPLNWTPTPGIGYTVVRRADGGMHFTFLDASMATLKHWRDFALQHLYDSDQLTRNLYDLRALPSIPPEAVQFAAEANSDPSTRNIRLAVVVANKAVGAAIEEVAAITPGGGADIGVFTDLSAAEAWLQRPLTKLV